MVQSLDEYKRLDISIEVAGAPQHEKAGKKQWEASRKEWIKEEIQSERRQATPTPAKTSPGSPSTGAAAAGAAEATASPHAPRVQKEMNMTASHNEALLRAFYRQHRHVYHVDLRVSDLSRMMGSWTGRKRTNNISRGN
jgi:hypothetical protein